MWKKGCRSGLLPQVVALEIQRCFLELLLYTHLVKDYLPDLFQNQNHQQILYYPAQYLALQKLMQYLMCSSPVDGQACSKCSNCQLFKAGSHPDFHHLTLEDKSKEIRITQIRDLISKLLERPHQGGMRLVLVEPADKLNRAAANAFLKTLEEPGHDTFILLKTSRPESLSATIRSRCQTMHIQSPDTEEAFNFVQEHHPGNPEIARRAVSYAQNRPLMALKMIESGKLQQRADFLTYLVALSEAQLDPVALASQYKSTEQISELCDWLFSLSEDAEKIADGLDMNSLDNPDQLALTKQISLKSLEQRKVWIDRINESKRTMVKGTNVNPLLTMESLMTGWIAFSAD